MIVKGHNLTLVEDKKATCTEDGNSEYYVCGGCDDWFYDKGGLSRIDDKTSVIINKSHTYIDKVCTACGKHEPTIGLIYTDIDDYS